MIPLQLTLKNFLSYREAVLDFRGLHTACICGANGAGKSSLLEAITWVIWGASRGTGQDDIIHAGTNDVRVDFEFIYGEQTYRVIRTRQRGGKGGSLDFQIASSGTFHPLLGKGIKDNQEQINAALKLDYKTFINSAYLRQGQADDFMKEKPTGRKQILVELLQLDQYETLAQRAKDLAKQFEGQKEQLERTLYVIEQQIQEKRSLATRLKEIETDIDRINQQIERDHRQLQQLQIEENQRQAWEQQLNWQKTRALSLTEDRDRLLREKANIQSQLTQLSAPITRKTEITAAYEHLLKLQHIEETLSSKFQIFQETQFNKQQLEQQLQQKTNAITLQIQQTTVELESLEKQARENQQILSQSANIRAGLEQLEYHRKRLNELDRLYEQVSPLIERKRRLEIDIERAKTLLIAKIEQLHQNRVQGKQEIDRVPDLREEALQIEVRLQELDKKQVYSQRVDEKCNAKTGTKQGLFDKQKIYEKQLTELAEKLHRLNVPDSVCPLCEQNLDAHHRHQVLDKTHHQQQEIQEQIWLIQEQMTACERDLQKLKLEYEQIRQELQTQSILQKKYGQLEACLEASEDIEIKLETTNIAILNLENLLESGNYAPDLQRELQPIDRQLNQLNYDDQTHALARGEEKRWRWAEIKQETLNVANRRLQQLNTQQPKLVSNLEKLQNELRQLLQNSPLKQEIKRLETLLQELGYDRSRHQTISNSLRQVQSARLQYQELERAERDYPELQTRYEDLDRQLQIRSEERDSLQEEIDTLTRQREAITDYRLEIEKLTVISQNHRQTLDRLLWQKGGLEEGLNQLEVLQGQSQENEAELTRVKKQSLIYQELMKAFGKNGIQSMMIENVLPQLEAQTNQILARLTGNQLHVQFLTQKAGKGSKKQQAKMIDTLDIIIADTQGSRPYETYSGGEAFRINFSIRLALAKLLAQRAGTALQLLIVDEGFGTQDAEGCDRLIAAINAISADFACILTVTHMPQFKEAFQHRIEVRKTERGSQLVLSS